MLCCSEYSHELQYTVSVMRIGRPSSVGLSVGVNLTVNGLIGRVAAAVSDITAEHAALPAHSATFAVMHKLGASDVH